MTVTVTCLECGEIFEAQRRSRKFCCDAHKLKYNRRRKRQAPAERKRERDRGYARTRRAAERQQPGPDQPVLHLEAGAPVDRLAAWAQNVLRVPPGHPAVGEPMVLPDYGRRFLADAMQDQIREALLTMSRKNGKSAIVAVLVLGYLAGPLRAAGWRGAVCSINKQKAYELVRQARDIAAASGLTGLTFYRTPAPGRIEADHGGSLDILAADAAAGAASGYDLVIVDELGLMLEKDRELLSGLKSSTSARDGKFLAITIFGKGPFVPEMLERKDDPAVAVHAYMPDEAADPLDPATWAAGNPGLNAIKSERYMVDRARLVRGNTSDTKLFAAEDCNIPSEPLGEMICTVGEYLEVVEREVAEQPPREGPAVVSVDAGGSTSMTAVVVAFPVTGRVEVYGAFPGDPDLLARGRHDGVGRRYQKLADLGQLRTYPGRSTPVTELLRDVAADLQGVRVLALGADRFRQSDVQDFLHDAGLRWSCIWRGTGASATADGSADIRAFQRCVLDQTITVCVGVDLLSVAIAESEIRRDPGGNPALNRARVRGRIDALQAAVIAAGLTEQHRARSRRQPRKRRHYVA